VNIIINPLNGYEQTQRLNTIYGTFTFWLRYNLAMNRWTADIINEGLGTELLGVVMTPGRHFQIARRIGFGGTLNVQQNEDILYLSYLGL
jgi:hypothetical protein